MSYPAEKAIPLAISTLDDVIKMVTKTEIKSVDALFEEIFITLYKDATLNKEAIDETLFRLHAASRTSLTIVKSENFKEIEREKKMLKEFKYKDAAVELGCSVSQIKKLVKEEKLKVKHYSSRDVRVTFSELERYRNSIL